MLFEAIDEKHRAFFLYDLFAKLYTENMSLFAGYSMKIQCTKLSTQTESSVADDLNNE